MSTQIILNNLQKLQHILRENDAVNVRACDLHSMAEDYSDQNTLLIVDYLQRKGHATVEQVSEDTKVNSRRTYDILNALTTTPLVTKKKIKRSTYYIFADGRPNSNPVSIPNIPFLIEIEQKKIITLLQQILAWQQQGNISQI